MAKKPKDTIDLLDIISRLESASEVLNEIKQKKSITQAVKNVDTGKHRTNFSKFMSDLELAYGFPILASTGERGGKRISEETGAVELVNTFQLLVADLVNTRNQLVHLRDSKKVPSVTIGTWVGIGIYLLPAVIKELEDKEQSPFDLRYYAGETDAILDGVMRYRYDFAILPSGDSRAKDLALVEFDLTYRRFEQGVLFLYESDTGEVPFPKLNQMIESPKTFSSDSFVETLKEYPLVHLHFGRREAVHDFDAAVAALFERASGGSGRGNRLHVPSYQTESILVRKGFGIGFGHPLPKVSKRKKPTVIRFNDFSVELAEYPDLPGSKFAFFPAKSIASHLPELLPFEEQYFSIYMRDSHTKNWASGGLSDWALRVSNVVEDICENDYSKKYPWLRYVESSDNSTTLVHDVTHVR